MPLECTHHPEKEVIPISSTDEEDEGLKQTALAPLDLLALGIDIEEDDEEQDFVFLS